jgi:serine/threonine protein kinase
VAEDAGTPSAGVQAQGTQGMLMPGNKIAGYVIEEQIGAGGMAVVYRARDDVLGRLVAVKVLSPALAADEEFRVRFLRESRAVAAVDESHIVPVYGAGDAGGVLYIASRFVAGGDLARLQRAAGGPLPPAEVADLISQVASALDAAHAIGLVHRDVKPGNILVERIPGRPQHAYLSDFGLSKSTAAGATGLTATGRFMGTPDYCAPEQITGGAVDGRADQYSLACVGFSLLAGIVPFSRGDSLSRLFAHVNSPVPVLTSIRPELPDAVNGVLAKAMAKNPAERYPSCAAFAAALRGALGLEADASPGAAPPRAQGPFAVPGSPGYQQTVAANWPASSVPPGSAGWQAPPVPQGPSGWQGPTDPAKQVGAFPPGAGGTVTMGPGQAWPSGPGQAWPPGLGQMPPGPGQMLPGPGQVLPGPGQRQRPPRRKKGLVVGGSAAAAVLVAGAIVGIALSSGHGGAGGSPGPAVSTGGTASPTGGATSAAAGADRTGTATLAGSVAAPGGTSLASAFLSRDGKYIVAASTKSAVYLWSTSTFQRVNTVSVRANDTAYPMSLSPDDKTLYTYDGTTGELYVLDVATGKAAHVYRLYGVSSPGYTFGGSVYGIATSGSTVAEYDMATDKLYAQVKNPGKAPVAVAGVAPDGDGRYLLISDTDGASYLVDALSKQVVQTFRYTYSGTSTVYPQISLDGNTVYVPGGSTGPAKLWDRTTRSDITPSDSRWPSLDSGVTFSTDSKFVLTSPTSVSETVDIWNIATRAHVITVTVPGGVNEAVESIGPGASEILSTSGLNINQETFPKLDIWAVPG